MTERAAQVLLIEDDETLRQILARHLRAHGYDVDEAGSAEEAAAILAEGLRPDMVLLDINLPGDSGWDLLRTEPGGRRLAAGRHRECADSQPSSSRRIRRRRTLA